VIRLWLSLAALNFILIASVLTAARAQPFDDQALRDVLFTPECAPPCFLNIHPGVTTRDEALAILRAHPWVASVTTPSARNQIYWTWNGTQPAFLLNHELRNAVSFLDGTISKIDLTLDETLGVALVTLGMPGAWNAITLEHFYTPTAIMEETFVVLLAYDAYPLKVTVSGLCTFGSWAKATQYTRITLSQIPDSVGILNTERAPLMRMALMDSCP
jgi:hypothetical protein